MASTPTGLSIQGARPLVVSLKRDYLGGEEEEARLSALSKGALRQKINHRRAVGAGWQLLIKGKNKPRRHKLKQVVDELARIHNVDRIGVPTTA